MGGFVRKFVTDDKSDPSRFLGTLTSLNRKPNEHMQDYVDRFKNSVQILQFLNTLAPEPISYRDPQLGDWFIPGLNLSDYYMTDTLQEMRVDFLIGSRRPLSEFLDSVGERIYKEELQQKKQHDWMATRDTVGHPVHQWQASPAAEADTLEKGREGDESEPEED
ncbi:hypothetical protein HDV00_008106 [Rhizophlyctis rosea]|nr:hypothetical protein HDV00_008106 [Rhizophlyctis rosea]